MKRISRRKLARIYNWTIITAGFMVAYLMTEMPSLAPMFGKWGPVVTVGVGFANIVLNRLPKQVPEA